MGNYKILSRDSWADTNEFLIDTENDLNIIPKNICSAGSTAVVVETGDKYILNNKKQGVKINKNNSNNNNNNGSNTGNEIINNGESPIIIEYTNGSWPSVFPMTRTEFLEHVETCTLPRVFLKYRVVGDNDSSGDNTIECFPSIQIPRHETYDTIRFSALDVDTSYPPKVIIVAVFELGSEDDNEPLKMEFAINPMAENS